MGSVVIAEAGDGARLTAVTENLGRRPVHSVSTGVLTDSQDAQELKGLSP